MKKQKYSRGLADQLSIQEHHKYSVHALSKREIEVLNWIAQDHTSKQIAQNLFISLETVHSHRSNLNRKLGAKTTGGMITKAFKLGILPSNAI